MTHLISAMYYVIDIIKNKFKIQNFDIRFSSNLHNDMKINFPYLIYIHKPDTTLLNQ